jgi:hypothetical protein
MASLTTPLSVRLSDEDNGFLAGLELEGAITASDKIRGLIRLARLRLQEPGSYSAALAISHDQLSAASRAVRLLEHEAGKHSDVVTGLMATAEEFLTLALTAPRADGSETGRALVAYEARLVDCAARMTEQLMRWAVTPTAPAYDPHAVSRRLQGLESLMQLILAAKTAGKGE